MRPKEQYLVLQSL